MFVNNCSFSLFAVSSSPLSQWQLHSAEGNWSAVCVVTHMTPSLGDMPAKLGVLLWHLVDLPLAIGGLSCWCWVWSFGNLHNSPFQDFRLYAAHGTSRAATFSLVQNIAVNCEIEEPEQESGTLHLVRASMSQRYRGMFLAPPVFGSLYPRSHTRSMSGLRASLSFIV